MKTRTRDYMIASMEKTLLRIEQIAARTVGRKACPTSSGSSRSRRSDNSRHGATATPTRTTGTGYESLHTPDHVSHNDGQAPWTSSKEMIENVSRIMGDMITIHHSYDPDIVFDTPTSARGIWAMTGGIIAHGRRR